MKHAAMILAVLLALPVLPAAAQDDGHWDPLPGLPEVNIAGGSGFVDGILYLFGGLGSSIPEVQLSHTWALNTAAPQLGWKEMALMPEAVVGMASATVNGRIYSISGGSTDKVYVFDPKDWAKGTWSVAGDPFPAVPRVYGCVGVIGEKIYIAGGTDGYYSYAETYAFDTTSGRWTQKADIRIDRAYAYGGAINGKFYVCGGLSDSVVRETWIYAQTWEFSPDQGPTGTWNRVADMPDSAQHSIYHGNSAVVDGRLFALGGVPVDDFSSFTGTLEYLPPPIDKWYDRAAPLEFTWMATAAAGNDRICLIGGEYDATRSFAQMYTPAVLPVDPEHPRPAPLPYSPLGMAQADTEGHEINPGGIIAVGSTIALQASVAHPLDLPVSLEIEVVDEYAPFTGTPTLQSTFGPARGVILNFSSTRAGSFKWRARAMSSGIPPGPWVAFGLPNADPDFLNGTLSTPTAPDQRSIEDGGHQSKCSSASAGQSAALLFLLAALLPRVRFF